jgi:two-component system, NarL family, nitrate/nitrite response regulator NarL
MLPVRRQEGWEKIRVVLGDADPLSRRILTKALQADPLLCLVKSVDNLVPRAEWPGGRPDVAFLVSGPQEDCLSLANELTAIDIRVILIGFGWTWRRLDDALAHGVVGFLNKDSTDQLGSAAGAVVSGRVVLSPDLLALYAAGPAGAGRSGERVVSMRQAHDHVTRTLTHRECEILTLLAEGRSTAEVADLLTVSPATVKSHVSHALAKLGVRNRLEAVLVMQGALPYRLDNDPIQATAGMRPSHSATSTSNSSGRSKGR